MALQAPEMGHLAKEYKCILLTTLDPKPNLTAYRSKKPRKCGALGEVASPARLPFP